MYTLIYISTALVVISKFLDCLTTARSIRTLAMERNPMARRLMIRYGTKNAIWGIFAVAIAMTALTLWLLKTYYDTLFYRIVFVVIALMISLVQFAVAWTNYTGRVNRITSLLLRLK